MTVQKSTGLIFISALEGVTIIFPTFPVYTISIGGLIAATIPSIEIWRMTRALPPGSFERFCDDHYHDL